MSCFYPLWAKPPEEGSDKKAVFAARWKPQTATDVTRSHELGLMPIPCGKCYGCRSDQRLQWTVRCTHEHSQHDKSIFLTLTIDDAHMPWHGSLNPKDLQNFFKRLRHECERVHNPRYRNSRPNSLVSQPTKIRYFACGEYGTTSKRAHYHALVFGLWPRDHTRYGEGTFTSPTLSQLWEDGTHQFSEVTPDRIAYTCGYTVKKMGSIRDRSMYGVVDPETGEYVERETEFSVMSRRPGIGGQWFEKYEKDLRRAHLMHEGAKITIPRYYERRYQERNPQYTEERKQLRAALREKRNPVEWTQQRLYVKETIARSRDETFKPKRIKEL